MKIIEQTSRKLTAQIDLGKSITWEFVISSILLAVIFFFYFSYLIIEQDDIKNDKIYILLIGSLFLTIPLFILNARFVVRSFIFDKEEGHLSVIDKGLFPFSQGGPMLPINEIVGVELGSDDATQSSAAQQNFSKKARHTVKLMRFSGSPVLIDSFYTNNTSQDGSNNEVLQQVGQIVNSINNFLTPVQINQEEADCDS